jgi:hypothetical protein
MAAQVRRVADMSVDELRALISEELKSLLDRYEESSVTGEIQQPALAAARQYIEDHRLTLPPGSPSVEELVRRERDRWQP